MCDLNSARVEEIAALPGVTLSEAYDLSLWRPYLDWEEVVGVPGFNETRVAELRAGGAVIVVPGHATWRRTSGRSA